MNAMMRFAVPCIGLLAVACVDDVTGPPSPQIRQHAVFAGASSAMPLPMTGFDGGYVLGINNHGGWHAVGQRTRPRRAHVVGGTARGAAGPHALRLRVRECHQ